MSEEIVKQDKPDDLARFANSLNDETPVFEKCKVCKSNWKKEAHEEYEKTRNIQAVANLLKAKGDEIKYASVRRHILNHYQSHQDELNLRELSSRLSKWSDVDTSDTAMLERWIKLFDMQATGLVAEVPYLAADNKRKNLELSSKLVAQVIEMREQLTKIKKRNFPVEMLFQSLGQIIEVKMSSSNDPELRRVLREVFDELNSNIGEIPIEPED